jgi:hypothetical protein
MRCCISHRERLEWLFTHILFSAFDASRENQDIAISVIAIITKYIYTSE